MCSRVKWPLLEFPLLRSILPDDKLWIGEKFNKQTRLKPFSQVLGVSYVVSLFLKSVLWCSFLLHSQCFLRMLGFYSISVKGKRKTGKFITPVYLMVIPLSEKGSIGFHMIYIVMSTGLSSML